MKKNTTVYTLRLAERKDFRFLLQTLSEADYRLFFGFLDEPSLMQAKKYILELIGANRFSLSSTQTLILEEDQKIIGLARIANIRWKDKNASFEIYILPEQRTAEKMEVYSKKILEYLFQELNCHKVYQYVFSHQLEIIEKRQKLKFFPEAILKQQQISHAKILDVYVYAFYPNKKNQTERPKP